MSFPRYPKYKDSGVDWVGEVPSNWKVVPLKHIAQFINGDAFKPTDWADSGIPIIRIQNLNGSDDFNYFDGEVEDRYLVHDGDLLFGWSGNRGTSFGPFIWRHKEVCALNQHIFRVVPVALDERELYWTLKAVTAHVEDQAHGIIGMVHITKGDLGAINVPVPPSEQQENIASFLDHETTKIDALVAEQEKLIALLKEKRQAVISHAVTKGLNPDAPMKDSGIEWLGEVPAHWGCAPMKYLVRLQSGGTPSKDRLDYWEGSIPWASAKDMKLDVLADTEDHITDLAVEERAASIVNPGTVLVVVRGMILARIFPVALTAASMAINQDLKGVICRDELRPEFLAWYFRGTADESLCRLDEAGHGTKALRMDAWTSLEIALPPLSEQAEIANFIETETGRLDTLTAEANKAVALLMERRSALISAAVTGKIDVCGFVAQKEAA